MTQEKLLEKLLSGRSSIRAINLLPWRCLERQSQRAFWIQGFLISLVFILMGAWSARYFFDQKIRELNHIHEELLLKSVAEEELKQKEALAQASWDDSLKEHQQLKIFLEVTRNADAGDRFRSGTPLSSDGVRFREARFESSETLDSNIPISWIGVTNSGGLRQWLSQLSKDIPQAEIHLVDLKKALGNIEFEAQVSRNFLNLGHP